MTTPMGRSSESGSTGRSSSPWKVEIEFDEHRSTVGNKVAQEYQVVYGVELDERGKLVGGDPERVDGQYNIYDSVPGMEQYSPLWQFSYVIVPRDYEPNTLRSEADCLRNGYPIQKKRHRRELTRPLSAAVRGA